MMITRLYTGDDQQSHFEDVEVDMRFTGSALMSPPEPVKALVFRSSPPGDVEDWHNSPYPHYVITISGAAEIELGDGTIRRFKPGEIILGEDLTGRGHVTRMVGNEPRVVAILELPG
ncbi:MAG TPA: hypothetical protein VFB90_03920 [Dehalococcoidia bacterium]|nr:hypothetical protein [Dehalococcoidia bacterium]